MSETDGAARPRPGEAPVADIEGRMIFDNVEARLFGGTSEPTRIGEHQILRRLGAGGMGEVYLAYNLELRRLEAIKILRTSRSGDAHAQKRLLAEAQALARLSHPNVVHVYRCDVSDGNVYIAMEYIEGPTLDAWQREAKRSWKELLQVYIAAGRGLDAAHRVGLVHRDFKPSNVLLDKDDPLARGDRLARRVRVIDFGLAVTEALPESASASGMSASATSMTALGGTPYYVSPEQCDDSHPRLTAASDQFSFCIALYEALYGQHPFFIPGRHTRISQSPTNRAGRASPTPVNTPTHIAMLIAAICNEPLRSPPDRAAPRRVFAILKRGLARAAEDRYTSMSDLLDLLERAIQPRRAAIIGAVIGGTLLGGTAIGVALASGPTAPVMCGALDDALADIWSPDRADAVQRAFQASEASAQFAAAAFRAIDLGLTTYASEWSRVLALACQETYHSGKVDESVYHRRLQCLDARRAVLAETVDQLIHDASTIRRVDTILTALPPIDDCAALQAPRCGDPAALADYPALHGTLAEARADERAGHFDVAAGHAADAQRLAAAHGDPALLAEAAFVHGRVLTELSRWDEGRSALLAAYTAADRAGCDELAIDALNRLAKTEALDPDPTKAATDWSPVLFARLERVYGAPIDGPMPAIQQLRTAEAISNRGLLRQRKLKDPACEDAPANCPRDLQGAHADFEEAFRLRGAVEPQPLIDLSNSHRNLGGVLFQMGRTADALDHLERGLASADEAFGADHPATWKAHFDLGKALAGAGSDAAEAHLVQALALTKQGYDPGNLKIGEAAFELALYYDDVGDLPHARMYTEEAVALFSSLPPTHPRNFNARRLLGHLYQATGAYAEALATRELLLTSTPRKDLAELATSHTELAQTLDALQRWKDADRHAVLAVDVMDALDLSDDPLRGEALLYEGLARRGLKDPAASDILREAERILKKNSSEGLIDPDVWAHAAWEVTRSTCSEVPPELQAWSSTSARTPELEQVANAIKSHDPTACTPL
jgi:tetratricopeptide (TPR) repeat protein/tRNA A-37 threonylcarbamoyl transferase component Bud32